MIKNLFLICFGFLIFSCQTKPVGNQDSKSVIWNLDTKAQITDKTNQSTNNVSIDIFLKKNEMIRMEVTALMGYDVGSLLMTRSALQYAVHPQKLFIQGPLAGRTLKPLFKQEIDPVILWSLVHNQSLKSRGFQCSATATLIEVCKNNLATVEIEQRGEIGSDGKSSDGQKKVTLENSNIKMIWIFKSIQMAPKAPQNETFVLNRPKEYKLITIK
jgi:hypothetical protein